MSIRIDGTNTAANPGITGADADTGLQFGTDEVNIVTGGTARATVDDSGRLLVGTSTDIGQGQAQFKEHVHVFRTSNSTTAGQNVGIVSFGDARGGAFAQIQALSDDTPGTDDYPGRLVFSTTADGASSPTERMRIRADGTTVTTGTTILFGGSGTAGTPRSISFGSNEIAWTGVGSGGTNMFLNLCDSAGNLGANYTLYVRGLASSGGVPATLSGVNIDSSYVVATGVYNQSTVAAANVHVSSNGTLYRSTSSGRFKTDVETIEDAYSDALLQCRPVWYRSTANGDEQHPNWGHWGFISEEVAEIDPRLVFWKTHETITDIDGNTTTEELDEPVAEGVQYDRFVPHLLNLIKRQKEQLETQAATIAALDARLTALEGGTNP